MLRSVFTPNTPVPVQVERGIVFGYLGLIMFAWAVFPSKIFPGPLQSIGSLPGLWRNDGLGVELFTSLTLYLQAVLITTVISLLVSYATALAILKPIATGFAAARFNGFVGLSLILTVLIGDQHWIKVALLVIGMSVFTIPAIVAQIKTIEPDNYDHARTLHMNDWRTLWEVVVRGEMHNVFDIFRGNYAIGWMMLPTVEGLFRSEGGIGVLLLTQNKYFKLEAVYGIGILIAAFGLGQDLLVLAVKRICCPYAFIGRER